MRPIAALVLLASLAFPAWAASEHEPLPPTKAAPLAPQSAAPQPDVRPYDAQLLRLSEVLGALTYLRGLCGAADADDWHQRMQALLDAEGTTAIRRERLAGAYNNGVTGYRLSYRSCTANAHLIIERFLNEAAEIARSVETRFGAT